MDVDTKTREIPPNPLQTKVVWRGRVVMMMVAIQILILLAMATTMMKTMMLFRCHLVEELKRMHPDVKHLSDPDPLH